MGREHRPGETRLAAPGGPDVGRQLEQPVNHRAGHPPLARIGGQTAFSLAEGSDQPAQLDLGCERTHVWSEMIPEQAFGLQADAC